MALESVRIFYSGKRDPEAQKLFTENIAYLCEVGVTAQLVDVDEQPELAEKHKIMETPILLVRKGGELHKYIVDVNRLKEVFVKTCLDAVGMR